MYESNKFYFRYDTDCIICSKAFFVIWKVYIQFQFRYNWYTVSLTVNKKNNRFYKCHFCRRGRDILLLGNCVCCQMIYIWVIMGRSWLVLSGSSSLSIVSGRNRSLLLVTIRYIIYNLLKITLNQSQCSYLLLPCAHQAISDRECATNNGRNGSRK